MLQRFYCGHLISKRTFKNFGHKREPIPIFTTLWHGFLTFTFIGSALNWNVINNFFFGEKDYDEELQNTYVIAKVEDS